MNKWLTIIVFLLLTGCATNPEIVDNLEALATPYNCYWHGVDVPDNAVHTGKILIKNQPFSWWGEFAAVERECGEYYPFKIGGCVKGINVEDFPDPQHEYEIVFSDKCSAVHEACHALFEVDDGHHAILSTIRMMQYDKWWSCPPTVHNMPWKKVVLPPTLDDPRVLRLPTRYYWDNHKYWDRKVWHGRRELRKGDE